jgi:hypothetical protein
MWILFTNRLLSGIYDQKKHSFELTSSFTPGFDFGSVLGRQKSVPQIR